MPDQPHAIHRRTAQLLAITGVVVTLAALGVATRSTIQARRLNSRLQLAQARADSAWSSMKALRDSIVRGGTVPPVPPYAAGHDSTWYAGLARSSSALEHFWHEQAIKARAVSNMMLNEGEIEGLRQLGLGDDPAADLRRDLAAHPELIPYHSKGGGRFQFYPEMAVLLPGSWVCAYFEDGHVPGYVLLQYEVSRGGKISWRRLDSRLSD